MTRIFATTAISICLALSISNPTRADGSRNLATDNGCFPWQDFKNGQCVAKPSQTPPPALPEPEQSPASAVAPPAPPPLTAAPAPPIRPQPAIVCDGGTVTNGACACPQGFNLMPAAGDAGGGTCARTDADSCLGGELTVAGKCICNGQVTMDGETYLLEYSGGKCLPMRCPVTAVHDGKCGAATTSAQPSTEAEGKGRPAPGKEVKETRATSDEDEHRRHCGRGMVMTRSGCVAAHRRQDLEGTARQYYRNFYPGPASPPF